MIKTFIFAMYILMGMPVEIRLDVIDSVYCETELQQAIDILTALNAQIIRVECITEIES